MRHPVLADLDLLGMFKTDTGFYFPFFYDELPGVTPTFLKKTQRELEEALGEYCTSITVGTRRTEFFFSNDTPIQQMFTFREKLNALVK